MPHYDNWLSFEEWCQRGGQARANFWRTEKWTNLERARYTHWVLRQRHWTEAYLPEVLADLASSLPAQRRQRRKRPST